MDQSLNFETIYGQYWDKIYRLCLGYVNDTGLAQDMAQETFVIVWQQLPNFRNESSTGTWIYRIAVNRCLRQIENDKRKIEENPVPEIPDENFIEHETRIKLLYKFISELPEVDRIIISLELDEVKQSEIANITGLSDGNVRIRIHRIKERLMQKFREYGY